MKKLLLSSLFIATVFIGKSFAQAGGEPAAKKGWPPQERADFIRECIKTATANMGVDSARSYCYCMQEKVERKFPTMEEVGKIKDEDMQTPSWQKDIRDCIASSKGWSSTDRSDFIRECENSAVKSGLAADKANSYCGCMLFKIEKKYPDVGEASKNLTPEKMETPEFKKMLKECLEF